MNTNPKTLLASLAACLFVHTASAVSLPYFDAFNYSEGRLNDVSGGNWIAGSSGVEISVSNAATLIEPAGFAAATGKGLRRAPGGTARRSVLTFPSITAVDGNVIYVSFLLNVQTAPSAPQILLHLDNASSSVTSPDLAVILDAGPKVGVGKNLGSAGFAMATNLGAGTHLIVARYTFQAGNDKVDLWVDPTSADYGAGTAPTSLGSHVNSGDPAAIAFCQIISPGSAGGVQFIDELRIGTTWAEVVPAGAPLVGEKLGFTTQPVNAAPGATMNSVVVQVQTAGGATVASNGVPVTLALTSGSGILSGTLTQNTDATGKATFSDLSIDTAGNGKQLTATASGIGAGLTAAVSANFTIVAPAVGTKLTFTAQPANGVINTTLNTIVVQIRDAGNAAAASNAVPITLTLTSGSGNVTGTLTQNTDNTGKATFNGLSIDTDGTGKQFTASASGIGTGLADAVSNPFAITLVPVGAKLGFTTQPASTLVNATMNNVVVQIQDANSAAIASNGVPITLTLTLGTGTLSGTTTQNTDGTGKATFSGLSINTAGLAKQLTASASGIGAGLASAPSSIFAINAPTVTSPPVITQAVMSVSGFILRGTNGTPSGEYRVLNGTNANQPQAQWASILTNTFNAGGNFACTNPVSPAASRGFYRLLSLTGGGLPDFGHYGYATVGSGVTGGAGGQTVTVTNYGQLGDAISNSAPMIIQVEGTIYMRTNGNFYVRANKTIIGLGTNATLIGDLAINGSAGSGIGASNVIVRNVTISNPDGFGEDDGLTIKFGAHHVWVDHCTFVDCADGNLDVTRESDFVTVSWCKFYYNAPNGHENVNLIGGNDDDTTDLGKLHVTFHHNWWSSLAKERMPSVRFGRVHVFNNYFNSPGNSYCTRARLYSEVLVENNYYDNVFNPWELATSSAGPDGKLRALGNITNNCTFSTTHYNANLPNSGVVVIVPGTDSMSSGVNELGQVPFPYTYTLDAALSVPTLVQSHAGAGKGPFAP